MSKIVALLRQEPVRAYIYTVLLAVVGLLVVLGVVNSEAAPIIAAVAATVLAVPAVEVARSKVSPVTPADTAPAADSEAAK